MSVYCFLGHLAFSQGRHIDFGQWAFMDPISWAFMDPISCYSVISDPLKDHQGSLPSEIILATVPIIFILEFSVGTLSSGLINMSKALIFKVIIQGWVVEGLQSHLVWPC